MGMEIGTTPPKVNQMGTIPIKGKEIHLEEILGVEVEEDLTVVLMLGDQELLVRQLTKIKDDAITVTNLDILLANV